MSVDAWTVKLQSSCPLCFLGSIFHLAVRDFSCHGSCMSRMACVCSRLDARVVDMSNMKAPSVESNLPAHGWYPRLITFYFFFGTASLVSGTYVSRAFTIHSLCTVSQCFDQVTPL
ncbi:hypothetical protein METBIDRAFT_146361 [Metschnikowia bicuspidata var. bicuspidata NRRL YB-4993]|uniref:Uncharacterized protein n=1 Tax=Metschnikowia bicuspidata var. bicuspidata NRRL YB-4993 TaxID=869754 RepID=A0A1A0HDU7_9ASCO|nr:hypothetical protein METBIDRAFT_146361 [Metschnikowia bicuspidata var. bicuspidata NRRL YB-4993]OBA22098.1 hypothetical protein METBIDRAFT_146361 [Metschnikowia bicuspidata var. bicuspidata NRRL YB-4993]